MKNDSIIKDLKARLDHDDIRGCVASSSGKIVNFNNRGVADLFNLLCTSPAFLENAVVADRVIGRGAALLLTKGKVRQVYARLLSEPALEVLSHAGIDVEWEKLVPNIINRAGTDVCPVERLTTGVDDPEQAFVIIRKFLTKTISK